MIFRQITISVFFLIFSFTGWGQEMRQLRLLDEFNQSPIRGVSYQYGTQTGVSDEQGEISLQWQEAFPLELSHLNYGQWTLSASDLAAAWESGVIYRKQISIALHPVTILALRPQNLVVQSLDFDYRDFLAHDAAALLSQTPLFSSIRKSGNYGFDPVFRGFKYDQLNVVVNGAQSATAACPNRMDPPTSQMAPNMLERVEILKGPHALRYGVGLGGTINFIPGKGRFSDQSRVYGRLSGTYEGNGEVLRSEGRLGFAGRNYDLSIFGAWAEGNDYRDGAGDAVPADFQRGSFGTQLGLRLTDQQEISLSATRNLARNADFPALPMDLREDDTWLFNLRHQIEFAGRNLQDWQTTLFGSLVDHRMDNRLKPLDPRMLNAETLAKTYNYGARTEGNWTFDRAELFVGADLRVEEAEGTRQRDFLLGPNAGRSFFDNAWQHGRISKTGIFAEYHWTREKIRLVLSSRLEINQASLLDPDAAFAELYPDPEIVQVNPSLSLGGQYELGEGWKAGLWLGTVRRSGSLTERFINFFPVGQDPYELVGNPDLKPEQNHQLDLSLTWHKPGAQVQIDMFGGLLQDFISSRIEPELSPRLPMSPGVRRFLNIDQAFKTGVEVVWQQHLLPVLDQQVAAAYTYAQDLELDEPLPEIAPLDMRYTLQGHFWQDRIRPELTLRYVARQDRISREFGETATPAFTLVDLQVTAQLGQQLNLSLGVRNLLDEHYYEHLMRSVRGAGRPIYAPGRNVFGSFHLNF